MPSSVVASMQYDFVTRKLRIYYQSGSVYDYMDVPPDVYKEMKAVQSKGTYLNLHIKGNYSFQKVV